MFEIELEACGSAAALARLVAANHAEEKVRGCRKLVLAAAWADAHSAVEPLGGDGDGVGGRVREEPFDRERLVRVGGRGTPSIQETCPAGLAVLQQQTIAAARGLIADALDLRHRLPRLWRRVVAGEIHTWKARQVAVRTRWLNPDPAGEVDRLLAGQVELVAWGRFERILDATMLLVDPASYQQRVEENRARRDVWAGHSSGGLRTLVARAAQGDVAVCMALVNRIADLLAEEGDEDPVGVRRSKAIGIIGNPAAALDLLVGHADQPDRPDQPWERTADDPDGTDPWHDAAPAGWSTPEHGHYHQPDPANPDDEACWSSQSPPDEEPDARHEEASSAAGDSEAETAQLARRPPADREFAGGATIAGSRGPRLKDGTLTLRPVTRAERRASRPRVMINVHLSGDTLTGQHGIVRTDAGPITVDELRHYLTDTDADLTVVPVLDPAATAAVDGYEIPLRLRRALALRHPATVFPYGVGAGDTDLDHTVAYRRSGPQGQTGPANLGPLTRTEHRAKTVGGWQVRQPEPGTYVWRSPQGWISITTNQGTLVLGDASFAASLWQQTAGQRRVAA